MSKKNVHIIKSNDNSYYIKPGEYELKKIDQNGNNEKNSLIKIEIEKDIFIDILCNFEIKKENNICYIGKIKDKKRKDIGVNLEYNKDNEINIYQIGNWENDEINNKNFYIKENKNIFRGEIKKI